MQSEQDVKPGQPMLAVWGSGRVATPSWPPWLRYPARRHRARAEVGDHWIKRAAGPDRDLLLQVLRRLRHAGLLRLHADFDGGLSRRQTWESNTQSQSRICLD